jgi:hypothetical protein
MMEVIIAWMLEHWFIEGIIMILLSLLIGFILGKAVSCINGDN